MADSFLTIDDSASAVWAIEQPDATTAAHPYLEHAAALAVFNAAGSGKVVRLRKAWLAPRAARTTTTQTTGALRRITAVSGGVAVTPTPFDSSSTALPSQVSVTLGGSVTTTGTELRRRIVAPQMNATRVLGPLAAAWGGRASLANARLYSWQTHADAQGHVLREGEGLAFTFGAVAAYCFRVELAVWFQSGSATWCAVVPMVTGALSDVAIMNGSGSGVVLTVVGVEWREVATDEAPAYTLEQIEGLTDGDVVTPLAMDSAASLPSGIVVRRNGRALALGSTSGAFIAKPAQRKVTPYRFGKSVGLAGVTLEGSQGTLFESRHADTDLVLREGRGVGIFQRLTASAHAACELGLLFSVENAATGGGGVQVVARAWA